MTGLFALPAIPKIDLRMRPYQGAAIERARAYYVGGGRRLLIAAPTGSGKTPLFSYIVVNTVRRGGTVLILAHRQELILQAYAKLTNPADHPEQPGLGIPEALVGVVMGNDKRTRANAPIQVGSVQTLASRITRRRRAAPGVAVTAASIGLPPARLVVVDEAHRAIAASYLDIAALYPDAIFLGVTATPYRMDGRGLGEFYDELFVAAEVESLIAGGWLVRTRVYSHPRRPDLQGVKVGRGGDYDQEALGEVMDRDVLLGDIVDHWEMHAGMARTFAYGASVPHARHIAARFRARGVPALFVGGDTPDGERQQALRDFRAGRLLVLTNYDVFVEGTDEPMCKCVILARPTKSEAIYRQAVGRAMRAVPGWPEAQTAVVLDHAGLALTYGLPEDALITDPADAAKLLRGRERRATGEVPTKDCPGCFRVISSMLRECPWCGWLFGEERNVSSPKEKDAELVEAIAKEKRKVAELRSTIQSVCQGKDEINGWDPGTTNKCVAAHFHRSRKDMTRAELADVLGWLMSPAFEREFPRDMMAGGRR